jgi:hypothetical protein
MFLCLLPLKFDAQVLKNSGDGKPYVMCWIFGNETCLMLRTGTYSFILYTSSILHYFIPFAHFSNVHSRVSYVRKRIVSGHVFVALLLRETYASTLHEFKNIALNEQ